MIRFLFRLILLAVVLLLLAFLFFPNIVSTKGGKALFFKVYKAVTGNTMTAETFDLSWWKGQRFENLTIIYPREKTTFIGPEVTTDATLWQLLFSHNLGNMDMTSPQVIVNADLPLPVKKRIARAAAQGGFLPQISFSHISMNFLPPYLGHVKVNQGNVRFLSDGFDPIELQNVALDISLLKTQIKLKGTGQTSQGAVKGNFDLSFLYNSSQSQIDLSANLQNFPMRGIDQTIALFQPALKGMILESVGEAINVQLKLRNLPQTLELFCDASSPSFSAHIETTTNDDIVSLSTPALVQFQLSPAFIHRLTGIPLSHESTPFNGQLKIDNLSLPLTDRESFSFQATLKGDSVQFPFGVLQPFALFVSTDNFKDRHFTIKVDSPQAQLNTALYFPDEWKQMTWTGQGLFPQNTHVDFSVQTLSTITATVQGDQWQGSFSGGFDPSQNVAFLNKPAEIVYHLAQLPTPLPPLLDQPTVLHIQIQPIRVSLSNFNGPVAFKIRSEPLTLKGVPISETVISATGNLKSQQGTFDLTSTVGTGTVNASGTFGWPEDLVAKVSLVQFPTSIIDLFLKNQQLAPIIGPDLNTTIDLTYLSQKKQISFDLSSSMISAQVSLEKTEKNLSLIKPAKVVLTLTPEAYAPLDHWFNATPTPFVLNQPAIIKASIPSFTIPCCDDKFDMSKLSCQADLTIDTLSFSAKNSAKSTQLNALRLHVDHSTSNSPLLFTLIANGAPEGSISLQGSLDSNTGMMDLNCRLDQFPTQALDVVYRAIGKSSISLETLFGPQMNLSATASLTDWNGPLKLQLNSPNIRTSLDGSLSNKLLQLNDTFHVQMMLTPDLSRVILNAVNPLSLSALSSEAPLTLELPAPGFSYPISPSMTGQMNIPSGRLELGKLYCHNEGNVNVALGLLKLSQFSQNQTIELWFAPLDFHIKNGVLDCERTEILVASTYQICIWGTINFVTRQVDMVLGLTASCLKAAFGIKNLPDDYVLQIPMKGTLDDVKINTSKATAKIAALLLWQQNIVSGTVGKGAAGAVLGQFMSKVGPLPDLNSKSPPAKKPFPWQTADSGDKTSSKKKKTSEASSTKKKKLILPDEQPLKQVLKMLM